MQLSLHIKQTQVWQRCIYHILQSKTPSLTQFAQLPISDVCQQRQGVKLWFFGTLLLARGSIVEGMKEKDTGLPKYTSSANMSLTTKSFVLTPVSSGGEDVPPAQSSIHEYQWLLCGRLGPLPKIPKCKKQHQPTGRPRWFRKSLGLVPKENI